MKIRYTTTLAALVALTAHPAAFAQDEVIAVLPEPPICIGYPCEILIEEPIIIVCPGLDEGLVTIDPVVDYANPTGKEEEAVTEEQEYVEEGTDEEIVEINPEEGEGVVTVGGWPDGGVPIEWIKRGGGELDNPDVIFYSMAGGPVLQNVTGAPSTANTESTDSSAARVLNQGETAAEIEGTVTGGAGLEKAAKKSTVAIVKQGRVFLR